VTGVQTCALPIWSIIGFFFDKNNFRSSAGIVDLVFVVLAIISAVFSIFSLFSIQSEIQLSVNMFTSADCVLGIVLSFIGLAVFTYSYFEEKM
jgi:hypothetical protein